MQSETRTLLDGRPIAPQPKRKTIEVLRINYNSISLPSRAVICTRILLAASSSLAKAVHVSVSVSVSVHLWRPLFLRQFRIWASAKFGRKIGPKEIKSRRQNHLSPSLSKPAFCNGDLKTISLGGSEHQAPASERKTQPKQKACHLFGPERSFLAPSLRPFPLASYTYSWSSPLRVLPGRSKVQPSRKGKPELSLGRNLPATFQIVCPENLSTPSGFCWRATCPKKPHSSSIMID